jgi:dihydrofolate reductase
MGNQAASDVYLFVMDVRDRQRLGGRYPVNGAPAFVLTHKPPAEYPRGPSNLTFVTDGIESAINQAQEVAKGKNIKLGGASPGKQALAAGCVTKS